VVIDSLRFDESEVLRNVLQPQIDYFKCFSFCKDSMSGIATLLTGWRHIIHGKRFFLVKDTIACDFKQRSYGTTYICNGENDGFRFGFAKDFDEGIETGELFNVPYVTEETFWSSYHFVWVNDFHLSCFSGERRLFGLQDHIDLLTPLRDQCVLVVVSSFGLNNDVVKPQRVPMLICFPNMKWYRWEVQEKLTSDVRSEILTHVFQGF